MISWFLRGTTQVGLAVKSLSAMTGERFFSRIEDANASNNE
jgi:hypothetical protein